MFSFNQMSEYSNEFTGAFENIRKNLAPMLSPEDIEKYQISGMNFYGMMNFESLENPDTENILAMTKILNDTNKKVANE